MEGNGGVTPQAKPLYEEGLAKAYPYHTVQGTVGLWSRLPLPDTRPVDIELDFGQPADTESADITTDSNRALRTQRPRAKGRSRCMWPTWGPHG